MKITKLSAIAIITSSILILGSFNFVNAYSSVSELNPPTFNKLFKFSKLVCGESVCSDKNTNTVKYDKSMKDELIKTQKKLASHKNAIEFMKMYYKIG